MSPTTQNKTSPSGTSPRVTFFIDGFNLYHSVKQAEKHFPSQPLKWLALPQLCESYLYQIGGGAKVTDIHYFTAYAEHLRQSKPEKITKHKAYIRALTAHRVNIHYGKFSQRKVWIERRQEWTDSYEEKETDVSIACLVLSQALKNELDVAVIMTGDSDFIPVVKTFKEHYPDKRILFAFPYARATKRLKQLCPDSFSISKEAYRNHPFPPAVQLPSGKHVYIPQDWKPLDS